MGLIEDGLEKMDLSVDDRHTDLLNRYLKEIALWNPLYGLVNAEGDQLIIRHLLDSLVAVSYINRFSPETLADIGSGAGLPGIPLAVFFTEVRFFLVERSGKRAGFLRNAVLALGLKNVTVEEKGLEDLDSRYDLVTFRGFSPFNNSLAGQLKRIVRKEGRVLAYKGKRDQIQHELNELDFSLYESVEILPVSVPFLKEERNLVTMIL